MTRAGRPRREPEERPLLRVGRQPGEVTLRLVEPARLRPSRSVAMIPSPFSPLRIGPRAPGCHLRKPEGVPRLFRGRELVLRPQVDPGYERSAVASRIRPLPARRPEAAGLEGGTRSSRSPPQAAELLAALVSEAGEVVPKEELLRRVWPDTFVEEANLSVNVSILRKALGEQPDGRAWIQTVARRGYRFLGAVRAQAEAPRSLAVLPFRLARHRRGRPTRSASGMADALITRLAATGRVGGAAHRHGPPLRVGADVDPVEAGRQLGVDAVVDGRLQRSGSRLRLTVQLVPTVGGSARCGPTTSTRSSRTSSPSRTRWPSAWRPPSWRS